MNQVILTGRLARNPEIRYTNSKKAVASFTLAVSRGRDRDADFIDCIAWEDKAEQIDRDFLKGDAIVVMGRLSTRSWEDQDGKKHKATEVVVSFVEYPMGRRDREARRETEGTPAPTNAFQDLADDGELPF